MNTRMYLKIFGYGLLLFLITMGLLFAMSVVTQSDQPIGYPWVGAVIGALMAGISGWLSRRLAVAKLMLGIFWAVEIAAILLLIAIPNQTTAIVFGQWSTYLVFIGVAVGPLLFRF